MEYLSITPPTYVNPGRDGWVDPFAYTALTSITIQTVDPLDA